MYLFIIILYINNYLFIRHSNYIIDIISVKIFEFLKFSI